MGILLPILIGKIISFVSRLFNLGAGGTWPGEIALYLDKNIFTKLTKGSEDKIILIAGTNGKTTTAKMIEEILLAHRSSALQSEGGRYKDTKILRNEGGANVLNGLVSTLIVNGNFLGKINADWLIFEIDEATLPIVLNQITAKIVVLLNLFRDQLDRYGEVDILAEKWLRSLKKLPKGTSLILNADDPQIAYLGKDLRCKVKYFGLTNRKFYLNKMPHATDSIYCPSCSTKFTYRGIFMSHLGDWKCQKCNLKKPEPDIGEDRWNSPLDGVYNRYNTLAAILVAKTIGVSEGEIKQALKNFQPAFGRQEEFFINGRKVKILLSKNPTGANEAIRTITEKIKHKKEKRKDVVLLVLNDRIPDGRDVSWIWDVDIEDLIDNFKTIIVSGERTYDMALRIKYSQNLKSQNLTVEEVLRKALRNGIEVTPKGEIFYILPTYSAMLEVRKILIGRKIL